MSFTVGFPNAAAVTIGGQSAATLKALNEASTEAADEALGETQTPGKVRTGAGAEATDQAQESGSTQSIAVQILLKRMQELQQQLREQQQQLAAAQARDYPTAEAKTSAVMAAQGQIADTSGALLEVTGRLVTELAKGASSGTVVNTTA
ncbi:MULTISPECIES: hypothetical protein [Pseudomonas]|uniref:Uncharacterized protein n=1 Tax=Pseudomonas brassicacearum (strain NFM421) TaxID=994484 RepID=F2KJ38_PSEBN|nr:MULTISPECIES: hypothetical protein [Pseudomonas]AEA70064.1 Conserved hypothetical protein [Pseudomonas brassicacearum subsp. brassicacearum NFM421]KIR17342.1 hypothetical protein PFLU4_19570 [Pseudomonas fluorescens]ROM94973.1 hypothetical protein BK657_27665 [Pseudomonas brassicacearum]ROM95838.1 hypothetical protein BK656_11255 [Pseudomonas brassicacearum]